MTKNKKIIIFSWTLVILWMGLIFSLSNQVTNESNGLSKRVTEIIIKTVGQIIPIGIESSTTTDLVSQFNHIIRKFAHGGVYFVLGILVLKALYVSGVKGYKAFIFAFIICILYAISDEIHQFYVPGRGPQVRDVCIDSFGAFLGIGLIHKKCWR
ncbi:VanZ family protein [Anaeromicrobium sediminis]|uniref:Phosphotransbutyrylase n=1 Tax=Anaeromicrobium sediminis TaxID=1478221 RepID=A0A267MIH5_9FIRM|nr:VanZ family protein [Anaeromicrobium sediminis]PAB59384.1 phosphotransbutyrylase [Anaeromicrobium sediminis]